MSLRDLIGEEKWQLLQKKNVNLELLNYTVVCETCEEVFFDKPLSEVQAMLQSKQWDPEQPQLWYIVAGRHWVHQQFHAIRAYVRNASGDKTLIMDLTSSWKSQKPEQAARLKIMRSTVSFEQAMLNELKFLESDIERRANAFAAVRKIMDRKPNIHTFRGTAKEMKEERDG